MQKITIFRLITLYCSSEKLVSCLRWTHERYRALREADRASVDALLKGTGVEIMLAASSSS
jgi:hypothetical protein